jgi:phosphoglucomutase
MTNHPLAGKPAPQDRLVDVGVLRREYHTRKPALADRSQCVSFGTGGHRGSSLRGAFNEPHVLAMTQAICDHRRQQGITGPLFLGKDTHALSDPAFETALEVLAANGIDAMVDCVGGYTPTPAVSHAILRHNLARKSGFADGIVITPSRNPPDEGGFKYNPPHGGPAGTDVNRWIEDKANRLLANDLRYVPRLAFDRARHAVTTHSYDYVGSYVRDLGAVVDMDGIRRAGLRIGVDPLGGAGVALWPQIAERYGLDIEVVNDAIDPTFRFMSLDWDGQIRMDPSSPHAMARLIRLKDDFDIAFGNDPDADRHGIVTRGGGLMTPNDYLAVAVSYLITHRPEWRADVAIGKTIAMTSMIDRAAAKVGRDLVEVPLGFRWFVPGLLGGLLGVAGDEGAGASFLYRNGTVWTTDKDGIIMNLLAAEMIAVMGRDPSELYADLARELGDPIYECIDAPATAEQKTAFWTLSPSDIRASILADDPITALITTAPGNGASLGGVKVVTAFGWFAAHPSATEAVYRLYAESFRGREHLRRIQEEAQTIVSGVLAGAV